MRRPGVGRPLYRATLGPGDDRSWSGSRVRAKGMYTRAGTVLLFEGRRTYVLTSDRSA
jgi:hypothetical protein